MREPMCCIRLQTHPTPLFLELARKSIIADNWNSLLRNRPWQGYDVWQVDGSKNRTLQLDDTDTTCKYVWGALLKVRIVHWEIPNLNIPWAKSPISAPRNIIGKIYQRIRNWHNMIWMRWLSKKTHRFSFSLWDVYISDITSLISISPRNDNLQHPICYIGMVIFKKKT